MLPAFAEPANRWENRAGTGHAPDATTITPRWSASTPPTAARSAAPNTAPVATSAAPRTSTAIRRPGPASMRFRADSATPDPIRLSERSFERRGWLVSRPYKAPTYLLLCRLKGTAYDRRSRLHLRD